MKKIYFDKLQSLQNGILLGIAILCFLISGIEYFTEKFENLDRILRSLGHVCLILIWCKMLIFRYYVSWNKAGINIRIKYFLGKGFSFRKIRKFQLENDQLTIYKIGNKKYEFDLSKVERSSKEKLMEILEQNTVCNHGSLPLDSSKR
ncbi:hypothetical protein GCM10023115_41580 [Pontixanthobacter gangjinensis]|uniref:Uncharacterized protein n=1 Tax=Christiangramia aestuarii TaxID=1028746 RepID=A0A7K1LRM0_9FLAO|nr:hypothetical protein [Christiangramia aestuarii]MUP43455.1 hypothetical protein [Christiangramia aestuarii]